MGAEKRIDPRFPFTMKVHPLDDDRGGFYETVDISAGGTYLSGDPGVDEGTIIWLRLELVSFRDGKEWVYPLDAEVEIVRITRDAEGAPAGFASRWLTVVSHGDIKPIQEFLRRVLSVSSGFVQAFKPRDQGSSQSFAFRFPTPGAAREGPAVDRTDEPSQGTPAGGGDEAGPDKAGPDKTIDEDPAAFLDGKDQSPHPQKTGIYVVLPLAFGADEATQEGKAVKLHPTGLRISTPDDLPAVYQKLIVSIPVRHRSKKKTLELNTTVTMNRPSAGEGDGQFEVKFSLDNDPDMLATYRKILDKLVKSLSGG